MSEAFLPFGHLGRVAKVWQPFSNGNTADLLEKTEHSLDAIAIPIAAKVTGNDLTAIGFGWDDWQYTLH